MASTEAATAGLLADSDIPGIEKDFPKVAVKPVESEEAEKRAQKTTSPSYSPSEPDYGGAKQNDGNTESKDDYDMKPPAAKKHRVGEEQAYSCPLLECSSEIMRNVYSFLTLKDALEVRRTCHELHDGNVDVFQYSNLGHIKGVNDEVLRKYQRERLFVLCNLGSADKLWAVLRNKSLDVYTHRSFLSCLVKHSKIDNAEAVSILLEHGQVWVSVKMLETALKLRFY